MEDVTLVSLLVSSSSNTLQVFSFVSSSVEFSRVRNMTKRYEAGYLECFVAAMDLAV